MCFLSLLTVWGQAETNLCLAIESKSLQFGCHCITFSNVMAYTSLYHRHPSSPFITLHHPPLSSLHLLCNGFCACSQTLKKDKKSRTQPTQGAASRGSTAEPEALGRWLGPSAATLRHFCPFHCLSLASTAQLCCLLARNLPTHPVPRTLLLPKDSSVSFSDWPSLLPVQQNENSSISLLYLQCHKRYLAERHPSPGRILFRLMGIHCARAQPSDFYLVPLSSLCVSQRFN